MGLFDHPELIAFRQEVRDFLAQNLTPKLVRASRESVHLDPAIIRGWQKILFDKGWAAPHWPKEYGGTGWDVLRRYIFEEELAFADAPLGDVMGLYLAGPMLIAEGNDKQKELYLPKILSGEELWCQGFSEPNAGSDLASLATTAKYDGTHWVVDGQKTWLTSGHYADLIFFLARTDPKVKAQAGLSMFIVRMDTPGITVKPIMTMDEGHTVNTLFFDKVRVPEENLVGQINHGWTYAKDLLARERVNNAQAPRTKSDILALEKLASQVVDSCGTKIGDLPRFKRRMASLVMDYLGLESTVLKVLEKQMKGEEPGSEASILKIKGSELQQEVTETAMSILGEAAVVLKPLYGRGAYDDLARGWVRKHFFRRVVTIYAGSNEIQRTIIAKSILRM